MPLEQIKHASKETSKERPHENFTGEIVVLELAVGLGSGESKVRDPPFSPWLLVG